MYGVFAAALKHTAPHVSVLAGWGFPVSQTAAGGRLERVASDLRTAASGIRQRL